MRSQYGATSANISPRSGGLLPPADVVISWPAPNFVNPVTRDWTAPVLLIIATVFTVAVFCSRMWARLVVGCNAGLDDLLIAISMVPLLGLTIASILAIRIYGFQWHTWDQTPDTLLTTREITLAIETLYLVATSLVKISILCFYRRMASGSISRIFLYCVWGTIVTAVLYCITFVFVFIFSCRPVEGYWRFFDFSFRLKNDVKCFNEGATVVVAVVVSTLQDFFICALPILLVWNLQIRHKQRAGLMAIFGMGLLTCICGILRTYYAIYVYYYTYDITWYAFYGWVWTNLEADLAVICASAPALKIFFKRYFTTTVDNSAYLSYGRARTPGSGYGKRSRGNTTGGSNGGSGTWGTAPVPLLQIHVKKGMDIIVEDRERRVSRGSDSSTRNLTALPVPSPNERPDTADPLADGCRTLCEATRPTTRDSRDGQATTDIEMGIDGK